MLSGIVDFVLSFVFLLVHHKFWPVLFKKSNVADGTVDNKTGITRYYLIKVTSLFTNVRFIA